MAIKKDFNPLDSQLESEIQALSSEVLEHHQNQKELSSTPQQSLRAVVEKKLKEAREEATVSTEPVKPSVVRDSQFLPSYLASASDEVKLEVERLVDLAFHKGLARAFREAATRPPNIFDAFHDAITSKLYKLMKERRYL